MTRNEAIYTKFETMEEQVAHCYFMLYERFISNPAFARFWMETALQELQHAAILRFCRERNCMAGPQISLKTTERIEQTLETVKCVATDPGVTEDEALYASLLLESSELEDIFEKLIRPLEKDHDLLFAAMTETLRGHHNGFAEAAAAFAKKPGLAEAFRQLAQRTNI
jgi:hypothetical protein